MRTLEELDELIKEAKEKRDEAEVERLKDEKIRVKKYYMLLMCGGFG
ncbi:MAG: hypothetical protein LBU74_08095 [Methanobacteriaceae archaeon]|jgi:uncharacterized membrane protein (DUF106 family)|nr:hypothetical protein [Candidatus Methanorudis spinitermitis]